MLNWVSVYHFLLARCMHLGLWIFNPQFIPTLSYCPAYMHTPASQSMVLSSFELKGISYIDYNIFIIFTRLKLFFTEELQILFHVCVLHDHAVPLCLCLLLGKHNEDNGCLPLQSLESFIKVTCFRISNSLYIWSCLVCWRSHWIPSLFNFHQSGSLLFTFCCFLVFALYLSLLE